MGVITGACGPYMYPTPPLVGMSAFGACCGCLGVAVMYVMSLYMWVGASKAPRDHPTTLIRRMISVGLVSVMIPPLLLLVGSPQAGLWSLPAILGLSPQQGMVSWRPPMLSACLFLGPLALWLLDGMPSPMMPRLHVIRNMVIAPISEEMVFRACCLPILLAGGFSPCTAVWVCPLFFGTAHLHHALELRRQGYEARVIAISILFQFCYTSLFGAFASYVFLRTGQLLTVIIVHSFCNFMGFPDFGGILGHPRYWRVLSALLLGGMVSFVWMFEAWTRP